MNCGTHANSDKVLLSARIVLADGTVLDTGDDISRASFEATHPDFYNRICELRDQIRANEELAARIRYKYSIKNVTGLNLLPFVSFDDPFDIIAHLMVGSEGTLAFLSQITMRTEYDYPHKASAMLYFTSIKDACRAVVAMKELTNRNSSSPSSVSSADEKLVKGAELLDYKSLSSVEDPIYLKYKQEVADASGLTAVLTETKARTREELEQNISVIEECLKTFQHLHPRALHRPAGRIFQVLGYPLRHIPIRRRYTPPRHYLPHRGRSLPHRRPARSHCRPATAHRPPRLR